MSVGRTFVKVVDFVKENPWLIASGVGVFTVSAVGLWAVSGMGDKVVIYTSQGSGAGEFQLVANRIAQRIGARVYPAANAQDIINAVRQHRKISRLIFVGHGTSRAFLRPGTAGIRVGGDALPTWISTQTFAREVGPRMTRGGVIGWAGCSAGSNPGQTSWGAESYGPCGWDSFVAHVRDDMARLAFIASGIEHRSHTAPGHASANPAVRVHPVARSEIGRCGYSLLDQSWGGDAHDDASLRLAWADAFQGAPSEYWIAGDNRYIPSRTA